MTTPSRETLDRQAHEHPLEFIDRFESIEDYCLHLMHRRSYEEAAALSRQKDVLDFGCNNGFGTNVLSQSAKSVIGVDVSPSALADARIRFPGQDFRLVDGVSLPFDSAAFDVVVSFQVIEHIADLGPYLAEIVRVLKPGGQAVFTTPNAEIRLDPGMKPWNRFHVHEYSADELRTSLSSAFADVVVRGLFAKEELYQVEYQRCQRALNLARNPKPPVAQSRVRRGIVRSLKAILPTSMIDLLRRMINGRSADIESATLPASILQRFSTADVFYHESDIGRALDLMAICTTRFQD